MQYAICLEILFCSLLLVPLQFSIIHWSTMLVYIFFRSHTFFYFFENVGLYHSSPSGSCKDYLWSSVIYVTYNTLINCGFFSVLFKSHSCWVVVMWHLLESRWSWLAPTHLSLNSALHKLEPFSAFPVVFACLLVSLSLSTVSWCAWFALTVNCSCH